MRSLAASVAIALAAAAGVAVASPAAAAGYDPGADPYAMAATTANTGATVWWNAGYTGKGVDVAVIDTGVAPVAGLNGAGKVVNGPDLSLESQNPSFRYLDTNGHGTFMAGLIAGHDAALTPPYASAPASAYRGMAPDARIVNVKVGVADGGVDVTQVIAGIDWVIQHRNDNGLNIRVINLSYGTNSTQAYNIDPLAYAVEQAWKAGIFVVVAAGNEGYVGGGGNMSNPARDPFAVAVGATNTQGTAAVADDTVAAFSAIGSKSRHVDLVTPGAHMQGLRVPNSFLDANHPEGRIDSRYFRGSGTSQAAAILSGAAALAIQQRPSITPGQLKLLLMNTAVSIVNNNVWQGRGEVDLRKALTAPSTATDSTHTPSTGTGSLDAARGTEHLASNGMILSGEQDIFGRAFNTTTMATAQATGRAWAGGIWNGSSWAGSSWAGSSWAGSSWAGSSWAGSSWAGSSWAGSSWSGSSWSGSSWSGSSWSGSSWSGSSWSGSSWSGSSWS
jgi:serine protease AprX